MRDPFSENLQKVTIGIISTVNPTTAVSPTATRDMVCLFLTALLTTKSCGNTQEIIIVTGPTCEQQEKLVRARNCAVYIAF